MEKIAFELCKLEMSVQGSFLYSAFVFVLGGGGVCYGLAQGLWGLGGVDAVGVAAVSCDRSCVLLFHLPAAVE